MRASAAPIPRIPGRHSTPRTSAPGRPTPDLAALRAHIGLVLTCLTLGACADEAGDPADVLGGTGGSPALPGPLGGAGEDLEGTPSADVDLDAPPAPGAWFRDEARARGLDFVYDSGHRERYWFPEIVGGGAALFDMEGDGDLDAYLVQAGPITDPAESREPNRLFANDGSGRFEDVTEGSGAGDRGYGMGVAAADLDNDGDTDLYVTNVGPNAVLRNDHGSGALRFTDVTAGSGAAEAGWSVSTSPIDYDEDGFLDLFVVNYIFWSPESERECLQPTYGPDYCSPNSYEAPAPDTLLRNRGDGTFEDVSSPAGIRTAYGNGLGCVAADFDLDGWTDVFVANDGMENQLWMNQLGQRFENQALTRGVAVDDDGKKKAGMGTAVADLDDDGDEDLIVVNLDMESDSLYENRGRFFKDSSARYGLRVATRGFTRWGVGFVDFDNDGALDLFQANGRVERAVDFDRSIPYAEPNSLLSGGHSPNWFQPVELVGGTAESLVRTSRAAAFGDVDDDGAVDILVVNRDGPAALLRNVTAERGGFARFRVVDEHGRDALGARLQARLPGGRVLTRTVRSDSSYCAANDPRVHLGLGDVEVVEDVTVTWLDGTTESFGAHPAGTRATLVRGAGEAR